jgi:hypothetical protein
MDFRPTVLKKDLVHRRSHQPDATPVVGAEIFGTQGIRNRIRVKSLSLVLDHEGYSPFGVTAAPNVNQFMAIHTVPMNDRIVESLPKCEFDGGFFTGNAVRSLNQSHQPLHERSNGFDFTWHPGLDLEGRTCVSSGNLRSQF